MNTAEEEKVNVDAKLSLNKFYVDEENAHIVLKEEVNLNEYRKLMAACPAGIYKLNKDGEVFFDYAGCLECGTCRILCGTTILSKWEFPRGAFGVEYRFG
ncbi:MAG TPA: 4Fe-4S dicluster domain-containing protein [Syntrophomonas sp.]|nr:4Fe-4S dicluster domain-containing protein [Syntrophomonas sp.]